MTWAGEWDSEEWHSDGEGTWGNDDELDETLDVDELEDIDDESFFEV